APGTAAFRRRRRRRGDPEGRSGEAGARARARRRLAMPAGEVRAVVRHVHLAERGEVDDRERRRVGDREALAGDERLVDELSVELAEEKLRADFAALDERGDLRHGSNGARY